MLIKLAKNNTQLLSNTFGLSSPFAYMDISPPLYIVTKDQPAGSPNLQIWTTEKVAEFIQKKQQDWYGLCIGGSN